MYKPLMLYFADPMCSWCWGFSPVIDRVESEFGDRFDLNLVMGGLSPGTTEPVDEDTKATIREHWDHVHAMSGQPFDFSFFERTSFTYDTEPACRAVVCARELKRTSEFSMLRAIHQAFYAENRDVTDTAVLCDLAAAEGFERAAFETHFEDQKTRLATGNDFAISHSTAVQGFPTLVVGVEAEGLIAITMGYQPYDAIAPLIERWLSEHPPRDYSS